MHRQRKNKNWGTNPTFNKTRLIYETIQYISEAKQKIIRDLVAYSDDPIRYRRRLRFLRELTEYEFNLTKSFENFQTEDPANDYNHNTVVKILNAVDIITSEIS